MAARCWTARPTPTTNAGNRQTKLNSLNSVTEGYTYDPLYQLTQVVQGSTTTESYSYDFVGNRLSSVGVPLYSYNTSNELTSNSTGSYTYDNNGSTLTDPSGKSYTWDFENRLTQVVVPGTGTVTFKYDPWGRRIQKNGPLGTANYLYDGKNVIEELDTAGNVLARYTRGQGLDQLLAELRSGTTSFYQQDALGSVTSLSTSTASLANTYTYDSYGKLTASTGTVTNPFRYTGREFDSETGLSFNRARYYDPTRSRWLSEDPIGFFGGVDFYAYVQNNPLNYRDPLGLQSQVPDCFPDCVHTQDERAQMQHDHDERMRGIDIPDPDSNNPPRPPTPPAIPCSCNYWLWNQNREIDERSWREVTREIEITGASQAADKAAKYWGATWVEHHIPWVEWGLYGKLLYDLWEIRAEVSEKYKHCH